MKRKRSHVLPMLLSIAAWITSCIFLSFLILSLLGITSLVYVVLLGTGIAALGGGIIWLLFPRWDALKKAVLHALTPQEKERQLETKSPEVRALEAREAKAKEREAYIDRQISALQAQVHRFQEARARAKEKEKQEARPSDNPLQRLLEQGVAAGVILPDVMEDEEVVCPITREVMQDPVKGEDGRTYDRFCLERIYHALPGTYPFNRQPMGIHPEELPRDHTSFNKIQNLANQYLTQSL